MYYLNCKITVLVFVLTISNGCQKENVNQIKIKEEIFNSNATFILDSIFSKKNPICVDLFKDLNPSSAKDYSDLFQVHIINNRSELLNFDVYLEELGVDFSKHSIVIGKLITSSISNNLISKTLYRNDANKEYKLEMKINKPLIQNGMIKEIFFWSVYSKLNSSYSVSMEIINVNNYEY